MTSYDRRTLQSFLRNEYDCAGKWNIPLVKKAGLLPKGLEMISFSDIKRNDTEANKSKCVHFFIDDYRMEIVYSKYQHAIDRLRQYRYICTPDYSLYADMPKAMQVYNVFRNRWCGAYWQTNGMFVIPTISWSDAASFEFCFDGVEKDSVVAISTIGCRKAKRGFMRGYDEMLKRLAPKQVLCFGKPFEEMQGNLLCVDYFGSRRIDRNGR